LTDEKPEVRAGAAAALGNMKSRKSIPKLKAMMDDEDPAVVLATAHSLDLMHDNSAYEVYYERQVSGDSQAEPLGLSPRLRPLPMAMRAGIPFMVHRSRASTSPWHVLLVSRNKPGSSSEGFNALNQTNLGTPNRFVNTSQFGTITMAMTPGRELQVSARLSF
jgi:hypothetical protein